MAAFVLIQSQVLASPTATVSFTSIPQTYTDLLLKVSARDTATSVVYSSITTTFDSSSSIYSRTTLYNTGTATPYASESPTGVTYLYIDYPGSNALMTTNTFGSAELYIPNYTTSYKKSMSVVSAVENRSLTYSENYTSAVLYNTTAAITQINLTYNQFATGSSFYLYGISNA